MASPILWIEGIIASGKSTFAAEVSKRLGYMYMPEPVDANPYLKSFYKDPKRWAAMMQLHLMGHRFGMKKAADYAAAINLYPGIIVDRCIAGDRVFAKLHHEEGNIHDLEWETYNYLYQIWARDLQPPTLLIYLDVQPETALERLHDRDRKAEIEDGSGFDWLGYLTKLRDGYEDLILELKSGLCPWSHAVEVDRFLWDKAMLTSSEWDHVAATISDRIRRAGYK